MITPPEMRKLMKRDGPAYYAATPVNAKIPPPIVLPIPNIVRLDVDSVPRELISSPS